MTEVVKGGLVVSINGIRGFIPASQAALRFVDDLASF
ncbi:MAG TPA: 30S ribosomal protein S1, partial [Sporomusaceae bacterium]|nr:30S ribosomal protein S1 [Sporomusaceae bacterium]